jgi:hypothetical protein
VEHGSASLGICCSYPHCSGFFNACRVSTYNTSQVLELNCKISNPTAYENSRSVVGYILALSGIGQDKWDSGLQGTLETPSCACHQGDWRCSRFFLWRARTARSFPSWLSVDLCHQYARKSIIICNNGGPRRFGHSASYLFSLNSSNHYPTAPDCLKLSKSISSRRLIRLTCLQTIYPFWNGIRSFWS